MKNLGEIGQLISTLYFELTRLSEKKSVKISGQSNLIALLTESSEIPIIITDHTGTVLHASGSILSEWELNRAAITEQNLSNLVSGVAVRDLLQEVYNQYQPVEFEYSLNREDRKTKEEQKKGTLQPVLNAQKVLAYAVWIFSEIPLKRSSGQQTAAPKQPKRFSDFFNRVKRPRVRN